MSETLQALISRHGEIENQLENLSNILEKGWGFQTSVCLPIEGTAQSERRAFALTDDIVRAAVEWQMQSLAIERTNIKKRIAEIVSAS